MKILWIILRSAVLLVFLSFTTTSLVENIESDIIITRFKSKGVYQEDISTDTVKYYKVENTTSHVTDLSTLNNYPGNPGDILCSRNQETIAPVLNEIISFYVGGHAGYCGGDYKDYSFTSTDYATLEASATYGPDTTCHLYSKLDWSSNSYFHEVIGLSVDMTEEERCEVTSLVFSYMDDPYNASFLFDTVNKSYCTDLVTKAYRYAGYDLNRDGFATSVFDLILSKDTYISYYHVYENGIKYIYYLG